MNELEKAGLTIVRTAAERYLAQKNTNQIVLARIIRNPSKCTGGEEMATWALNDPTNKFLRGIGGRSHRIKGGARQWRFLSNPDDISSPKLRIKWKVRAGWDEVSGAWPAYEDWLWPYLYFMRTRSVMLTPQRVEYPSDDQFISTGHVSGSVMRDWKWEAPRVNRVLLLTESAPLRDGARKIPHLSPQFEARWFRHQLRLWNPKKRKRHTDYDRLLAERWKDYK